MNRVVEKKLECCVVHFAQTSFCAPPEGPFPMAHQNSETTFKKRKIQALSADTPDLRASSTLELPLKRLDQNSIFISMSEMNMDGRRICTRHCRLSARIAVCCSSGWPPILKMTCWVCGTTPSNSTRERARAHHTGEPELPTPDGGADAGCLATNYQSVWWLIPTRHAGVGTSDGVRRHPRAVQRGGCVPGT